VPRPHNWSRRGGDGGRIGRILHGALMQMPISDLGCKPHCSDKRRQREPDYCDCRAALITRKLTPECSRWKKATASQQHASKNAGDPNRYLVKDAFAALTIRNRNNMTLLHTEVFTPFAELAPLVR
jgi:hypothetical protein